MAPFGLSRAPNACARVPGLLDVARHESLQARHPAGPRQAVPGQPVPHDGDGRQGERAVLLRGHGAPRHEGARRDRTRRSPGDRAEERLELLGMVALERRPDEVGGRERRRRGARSEHQASRRPARAAAARPGSESSATTARHGPAPVAARRREPEPQPRGVGLRRRDVLARDHGGDDVGDPGEGEPQARPPAAPRRSPRRRGTAARRPARTPTRPATSGRARAARAR